MILLSQLTGCGESIGSIEPPVLAPLPVMLREPCEDPIVVPEPQSGAKLPQKAAEYYWIQDRKRLIECKDKHLGTIEYYETRDGGIDGSS